MFSLFLAAQVAAASPAVVPAPAEPAAATTLVLPALTPVRLRVLADLASKRNATGDEFDIELAEPIALGDGFAIPAGTRGRGWVIHADKARFGGKPGELSLGARHLQLGPVQIPLRSMRLSIKAGKDNGTLAMAMGVAGGLAGGIGSMFVTGGQQRVANGVPAEAKTAADVALPIALLTPIAPPAAPAAAQGTSPK